MKNKFLLIVLVVVLGGLALVNYQKRVNLASELQKLSIKMEQLQNGDSENKENQAQANLIIEQVRKLMLLPTDVEPTVAKIVDVKTLQSKNDFYKNAKNGDYLIVTPTRAILYDPAQDMILDVAPVQLEPVKAVPAASASSAPKKK